MKVVLPGSQVVAALTEIPFTKRPPLFAGNKYDHVYKVEAAGKLICYLGTDFNGKGPATEHERRQWILWTTDGKMWSGFGKRKQEAIDRGLASDAIYIS